MFKSQILRNSGEIEKPHVKFCKRILGVHAKATNITDHGLRGIRKDPFDHSNS